MNTPKFNAVPEAEVLARGARPAHRGGLGRAVAQKLGIAKYRRAGGGW